MRGGADNIGRFGWPGARAAVPPVLGLDSFKSERFAIAGGNLLRGTLVVAVG